MVSKEAAIGKKAWKPTSAPAENPVAREGGELPGAVERAAQDGRSRRSPARARSRCTNVRAMAAD
jgi:hypothetical protein